MPLGIRIFLVYVLFIGLTGYFVLNTVMEEIRSGVRQSTEETLVGHFSLPTQLGITEDFADYQFDQPFLAVGISDIRGIENALKLELNGQNLDFVPGSQVAWLGEGVHVTLPALHARQATELAFGFDLRLQGTGLLQVLPVGKTSKVALSANWPHPSFIGNYLPTQREITDQSFTANWQTSFFSTNLQEALNSCVSGGGCQAFYGRSFGVSFIDPVDQYLKSDRAIKYALLFIVLTFAGFFLFDVLKSLAVHPVQYALVGVALAFFRWRICCRRAAVCC